MWNIEHSLNADYATTAFPATHAATDIPRPAPSTAGWNAPGPGLWTEDTLEFFTELPITPGPISLSPLNDALVDQGIKWTHAFQPQCIDRAVYEYTALINLAFIACESRGSVIEQQQITDRSARILGISIAEALESILAPLADEPRKYFTDQLFATLYIALEKQKEIPTPYYLTWVNTLSSGYDDYIRLRNIDGGFGLAVVFRACMLERESATIDRRLLSATIEALILAYDCTSWPKHRSESESCNIVNYMTADAIPALVTRAGNIFNFLKRRPLAAPYERAYTEQIQAMYGLRVNNPRYPFAHEIQALALMGPHPHGSGQTSTWYRPTPAMTRSALLQDELETAQPDGGPGAP
ncbi:hypothetical protein [Wenjunlia tyrosinilytica]|uniref:Uncharacterized protein n=1 Tax=Wenjunlia tyrosinilytica TaxID=1544741 RepID=A0A917ZUY5_9ACTN|nr:hypothetical protein [Wenjunlia tyrosinilytica]GGO93303.1 hypothetical protein GCM10012280_45520 [Wenjunlia tyrosinilytica]